MAAERSADSYRFKAVLWTGIYAAAMALVGWLVIREGFVAAWERSDPLQALEWKRNSPEALESLGSRLADSPSADHAALAVPLAKEALARSPLLARPFVIAAQAAEQSGNRAEARRLMEEALRRDPRNISARLWLLEEYAKQGAVPELVANISAILRLRPERSRTMMPVLISLIDEPAARAGLAGELASDPAWRSEFFLQAGRSAVDPAGIYEIVQHMAAEHDELLDREELSSLLVGLTERGQYRPAYMIFLMDREAAGLPQPELVFDGGFDQQPGPRPFAWRLESGGYGGATFVPDEGGMLSVRYLGQDRMVFARQMILLSPGRYQIVARGWNEDGSEDAGIGWTLQCHPGGALLAQVNATSMRRGGPASVRTFSVPAGCPAQTLALVGEPGDETSMLNARIESVRIERVTGQPAETAP